MMKLSQRVLKDYGKELSVCSTEEIYLALLRMVKERAQALPAIGGTKKLYYISAEFLLGKLLSCNLINLGLYSEVDRELKAAGKAMTDIENIEPEPSLGNGGLGRLAACFLDSIASLGLRGDGVGINYHFGLFKQYFKDRKQHEAPNPWMEPQSWLTRSDISFPICFKRFSLRSTLYEMDVVGYEQGRNSLRLFDLDSVDESIVHDGISFDKTDIARNLTLFLYPDDSDRDGHLLRIYQQYFMVSSAAQLILLEMDEAGYDVRRLDQHVVVQINDTHPSMVIPELIRLLQERGLSFEEATGVVSRTCAYTNHTILSEALETWPESYIEEVAPQLIPIIHQLDAKAKKISTDDATAIIDSHHNIHMAHMDIHYSFSVNGVAALHTNILETTELKPFHTLYPKKFNNKTNGITFRRWLMHCNPQLASLITDRIGDGWKRNAMELEKLLDYIEDKETLNQMAVIKRQNKHALRQHLLATQGINLHDNALFDIQIKRMHEYKRQQMNALYVIHRYKQIKAGHFPPRPLTILFGGKAAAAYVLAKDVIHLILCLQALIASDPKVSPWLQVVMVENYNVTLAEKMIPACDISEQISLASKEASGTGNMKFMLNGAVTLGTLDGANVEIRDLVGDDNIFIFGRSSEEVIDLYRRKGYHPEQYYRSDPLIESLVDFIVGPEMRALGDMDNLLRLYKNLITKDWFMTLLDLRHYIEMKDWACGEYENHNKWNRKMLINTAKAGFFASDRTIRQYNEDIWRLEEDRGIRVMKGGNRSAE